MSKPVYHILVCASFRSEGGSKGVCHKKGHDLLPYIESEILERGLDAQITGTGCLKVCDHGPVMVVHPPGHWYGRVETEAAVDEVLDALENGQAADRLRIA